MSADVEQAPLEEPGVPARRVVAFSLGFVAFAILLAGGLAIYYRRIVPGKNLTTALQDFPVPRLQPNPSADWESFHRAQLQQREGYAWVDRTRNLIHIPVERAKALVAARGAAGYDPVEGTPPYVTATGAPLDGAPRAAPQPMSAPYGQVH